MKLQMRHFLPGRGGEWLVAVAICPAMYCEVLALLAKWQQIFELISEIMKHY